MLEQLILDYINRYQKKDLDSLDILINFKDFNSDKVLEAMFNLEKENKIERQAYGIKYRYVKKKTTNSLVY